MPNCNIFALIGSNKCEFRVKRAFKSAHVTEAGLIQCCAVQEMLAPHATLFSALGIDLKLVLHLLCESDKKEVESEEELAAGS